MSARATVEVGEEKGDKDVRDARDHAPGLELAFALPAERTAVPCAVEGEVPGYVRGTYYLNGPARFARGDVAYRHWLDGDGMVVALRFGGGAPEVTARFVRSTKHADEEAAGRALYRTFGTAFPGDRLLRGVALASPVNVSVYPWNGTLLALGEQGLPWELDPVTLETRGEHTFGGRLNPLSPLAAHAKIDPETGELVAFGISFSAASPTLNLYRFAAQGDLLSRRRIPLEHPCSLHDFGLAPRHAVFYLAPYLLDMGRFLEGSRTLMQSLTWRPELGTRLLVVDRESGEPVAAVPLGLGYCLHLINCFEADGRLVVDVLELEEPVYDEYEEVPHLFRDVTGAEPVRYVIDLERRALAARRAIPWGLAADFPAIDQRLAQRPYRDLWMLSISATGRPGRKFLDQLVHVDWEQDGIRDVWQAPAGRYLGGEPVFIGHPGGPAGDREGVVICQQLDVETGEGSFLVFDALAVARGPIATIRLEDAAPPGLPRLLPSGGGGATGMSDWRADLDRFAATRAATLGLVRGLSQGAMDAPPAGGGWSAGEVVDHLLKAEAVNRREVESLVALAAAGRRAYVFRDFTDLGVAPPFVPEALLPWLTLPMALGTLFVPARLREAFLSTRLLPAKAPEILRPRRGRPAAELVADLESSLATTRDLFESHADLDFDRMVFQHPLLGVNTAVDVLRLIDVHERRHQDQLREVLRRRDCRCRAA